VRRVIAHRTPHSLLDDELQFAQLADQQVQQY
jgi:hypothetical protein